MDYLSLCLICKDENDYLPEWLDYHILMGVDRFYIYDNESQISLRETLADYIKRGWVVVIDIQGAGMQLHAYDHCLQTFGKNSRWIGFIDTDEFLVPKDTLNLQLLLKDYEEFGGLAVSSKFFGSDGNQTRPAGGQITGYIHSTHLTFRGNSLVKSIVQPDKTLFPITPHDFLCADGYWCVNEKKMRVNYQYMPHYADRIQLNHYYCRSEEEISQKLTRGRGDRGTPWQRQRFNTINRLSTYKDTTILQTLSKLFKALGVSANKLVTSPKSFNLLAQMANYTGKRAQIPLSIPEELSVNPREEIDSLLESTKLMHEAEDRKDYQELVRLIQERLKITPFYVNLYTDLSIGYLNLKKPAQAWQVLAEAWRIAPNSFTVLSGMAFYFLKVENYSMAEKTCRLMLDMAPHDLTALAYLTDALMGQNRFEEAIKIGTPVVELSAYFGEIPSNVSVFLIKKMSDYLVHNKDYAAAIHLWEVGIKCQENNVLVILELVKVLLKQGNKVKARQWLEKAKEIDPNNPDIETLQNQAQESNTVKKTS